MPLLLPMPVPSGFKVAGPMRRLFGDDSSWIQAALDAGGVVRLEPRVYTLSEPLRITRHGTGLECDVLPPRQQDSSYGARLRYNGGDAAIIVGRRGQYISNVRLRGLRVEAPSARACIRAHNPATSFFEDLSLIGPLADNGGKVMHVLGGIQVRFKNVDACGMGIPEAQPRGDFARRAVAGVYCEGGEDENGRPSTFTAFTFDGCYLHQCRAGIVNHGGLVTVGSQTIFEDNLLGLLVGDSSRCMVRDSYWEAQRNALIHLGKNAHLSLSNCELGNTANAPIFFDGDEFLALTISGGYIKGPGKLFGARARPGGTGSFATAFGVPMPADLDIGPLTLVGVDGRGAGR